MKIKLEQKEVKMGSNTEEENDQDVLTINKDKLKRPPRYKVLLHNDDYTTMEFVVLILKVVFGKTESEAQKVMLEVHTNGAGVCGVYTHEIAETKAAKVQKAAQDEGYPLKCTIEPE